MDILQQLCVFIVLILYLCKDVTALTISASRTGDKALYGSQTELNPKFTISCAYNLEGSEQLYFISLARQREGDADFKNLITFQPPGSSLNTTYTTDGEALRDRTTATGPTSSSTAASLVFNDTIECDDKATYRWLASYSDGNPQSASATVEIVVKTKTTFKDNSALDYSPKTDLKAGDEVTFTCTGDVGKEPSGSLAWFYYTGGNQIGGTDLSSQASLSAPSAVASRCSYSRTSTLRVTLTRAMDLMVMRCTVQQDVINENGDFHKQTTEIPVNYPPVLDPVVSSTGSFNFTEGDDQATLTCSAESKPPPTFYWVRHALDNGTDTVTQGNTVTVTNMTQENSGRKFTCVAYNEIGGQNYTVNSTVQIFVSEQTTTPVPTTTTTVSSTADTTVPGGGDSDDNTAKAGTGTTTIIIIVVVVVVVLIIALAVFFVYWKKRSKKDPEIEEPPDKPRNNRDLTFSSNRPDLVSSEHGMKNNALNTSFNSFDSTDMKPPREDGLMYIDLQFDDKPRSRRPIQLLDNGTGGGGGGPGSPYADIAMPRV